MRHKAWKHVGKSLLGSLRREKYPGWVSEANGKTEREMGRKRAWQTANKSYGGEDELVQLERSLREGRSRAKWLP